MTKFTFLAATLATVLTGPVLAQGAAQPPAMGSQPGAATPGTSRSMQMAPGAAQGPSPPGYMAAMDRMMRETPPLTGDADRDFAAQMIPHHQAAVDMARVELQHGRDSDMRKMAEEVIAAQEREIAQFRSFLARQPAR
jgi:uncharacterized protein (DUF305 family)